MASVIKAALTVHRRQIAPQAHLTQLNPAIPFAEQRLRVPTEAEPFPPQYPTAAVSVNGFGYGGTNAHAILVEPPEAAPPVERPAPVGVLPLSGRNDTGARQLARDLLPVVADPAVDPATLVDGLWSRRAHHNYRFAVPFGDRDQLLSRLTAIVDGTVSGGRTAVDGAAPAFVFSGMGPQWWRMGRDLLTAGGPFAGAAGEVDEVFAGLAGWSLRDELRRDEADSRVTATEVAQPANFLVQVGLAAELAHYGVQPAAVVGHSVGEVSAAYVSGMLSLEDAVTVSYHRSRLQATTAGTGGMLAVGLSEAEAVDALAARTDLCIAAVNSPSAVTLAGTHSAIGELADELTTQGVFVRRLQVEVPYHSQLMDPILAELTSALADLRPRTPTLPLYSTVTAKQVTGPDWDATYWCANVREPVRFADAMTNMVVGGDRVFLEIGPHPVLSGSIREIMVRAAVPGTAVATLNRQSDDHTSIRTALADLYVAGALDTAHAPGAPIELPPQRPLPSHRFQRTRMWSVEQLVADDLFGSSDARALPGDPIEPGQTEWRTELAAARLPWLRDHAVEDMVVLPGAAYIDAALAAAAELTGRSAPALEDVRFVTPLVLEDNDIPVLRLTADPASGRFSVSSRSGSASGWTRHAHGRIVDGLLRPTLSPPNFTARVRVSADQLYPRLADRGLVYGPQFRRIVYAEVDDGQVVARVDATATGIDASNHQAHPTVVDAALQCVALLVDGSDAADGAVVPAGARYVRQFAALPDQVLVAVTRRDPQPGEPELVADVVLSDLDGVVLLELHRVQFRPISPRRPVLARLEKLWAEPRFESREPRDPAAMDAALATERVMVISAGEASTDWADDYAARRGAKRPLTVSGSDPALVCSEVQAALGAMVMSDPENISPVVVAFIAATTATPPPAARAAELPALLVGTARAMQNIADEALSRGVELPLRGLVITRGALPVGWDTVDPDVAGSTLVGARRVLRNEQPQLSWRLVDVDDASGADTIVRECLAGGAYDNDDVDEVALRGDQRVVIVTRSALADRLADLEEARPLTDPEANFEIAAPASGRLADLALREIPRIAPGPGEFEMRVEGIGLNFKDPMKVMGVLGEAELAGTHFGLTIGMEGLGVVTRVGPGVTGVRIGESRFVAVAGMAQRYVITRIDAGETVPGHDLPLEAYGSIVVLMTAHYALKHAAHVEPGDWVLVTGGAGGVGMAAVQIAAKAGARVIATASTPDRAAVLRSLGAEYVVDSRSLSAMDEVRALTGGHGADVVISAAPGEAVVTNLKVAAEFGRVVEVGKTEIFGGRLLDMAVFNKNLALISIDLDRMMARRRDLMARVNDEVLGLIASGEYELLPTRILPVSQLVDAFDQVARSNQLGRVVLDFRDPAPPVKPGRPIARIRSDAAYLITGGLGDFGLATAAWLAARGAGRIVLAGRRGAVTDAQRAAVAALAARAEIRVEQLDVAERSSVDALLARLSDGPQLRGVFHAAGVLADEPLDQVSTFGLEAVLSPKARGALNLHDALAETDLDMFVLYSSVTSMAGTVPQYSYAAANSLLDWLAHYRRNLGLPGLSINWGSLAGGMAASSREIATYLSLNGLRPIPLADACEYLDAAIALDPGQAVIADIDMGVWGSMHPASAGTPRFAERVTAARAADGAGGSVRAELAAMAGEQRIESLATLLTEMVAAVLGIPNEVVDVRTPLPDLGLDSLMAVELRARVNMTLEMEISAMELNRSGGLSSLAARLADQITTAR